jgi:hypothetical protein
VIPVPDALPPLDVEVEAVVDVLDPLDPEHPASRAAVARTATTTAALVGVRRKRPGPDRRRVGSPCVSIDPPDLRVTARPPQQTL